MLSPAGARKFLGLLPEVARRRLYEQYGFSSELAGVSEEQVRRTLNLDLRFLDKPILRVKRVIEKEFGKKCAISHCNMPAVTIHHTARFALSGDHNPYYLAPLCREHHQIAHAIDEKYYNLSAMSFVTSTVRVL